MTHASLGPKQKYAQSIYMVWYVCLGWKGFIYIYIKLFLHVLFIVLGTIKTLVAIYTHTNNMLTLIDQVFQKLKCF